LVLRLPMFRAVLSAHHQEFLAVHLHWYNLCSLVTECHQAQVGTGTIYIYIYIYIYTHTHIYRHTYTHIHTHVRAFNKCGRGPLITAWRGAGWTPTILTLKYMQRSPFARHEGLRGCIAPFIFNIVTTYRWVVSFRPWLLHPAERAPKDAAVRLNLF
jgi:hypothetical protein